MTTGKTIALTRRTFVGRVTSLLFNMLSRLVITFLPRSKCPLISWLQSPSAVILEPRKIKSATFPLFPHLFPMKCWKKNKLESRLPGEISITSDMQMTPPYGRKWRETKKPLDESERGEWKSWLKAQHSENEDHGIWSHHFMGNMGKQWKQCQTFIWGVPKITADGDCSHEMKRCLLLGRKVMTNLDNILKSRDITLPTKVCLVKAMVFPVVMYGCESWTIKKADCQRIDAFQLCFWRRLLRVPWTARRSNQFVLKESSLGCSLLGLMVKLKL